MKRVEPYKLGFFFNHSGILKVGHIHKQKAQPPINCGVGIDAYEKAVVPMRGKEKEQKSEGPFASKWDKKIDCMCVSVPM